MPPRPVLIGLPYDAGSSFLRGAAEAPAYIRRALASPAGNPYSEQSIEVVAGNSYDDRGDIDLADTSGAHGRIEAAIRALAAEARPFVALGGDHSITYPVLRGLAPWPHPLTILQIDAHPDLYDVFDGDRLSHACPFARILEEALATHLVQVGLRSQTPHQREQARRFRVEQIDMRAWAAGARPSFAGDVYLSLDLDALDPAFAPGVSHREPGGLTTREVIGLFELPGADLVAADVVEFNPAQDIGGMTASVAAKLVKELLARIVQPAASPD